MDILGRVTLLNNDAIDSTTGLAIAPTANDLKDGQIAVNYSTNDPCLFIKDNEGNIIKFTTEKKIAQTLSDILGESAADLSTLKELLSAFNGSDNDVLTLIKNIQTELGTKASAATLNNHIASTSNPHSVTATQVGALPLAGGAINGHLGISREVFGALTLNRANSEFASAITFKNANGTLGSIGMSGGVDGGLTRWSSDQSKNYKIFDAESANNDTTNWTADTLKTNRIYLKEATDLNDIPDINNTRSYCENIFRSSTANRPTGIGIDDGYIKTYAWYGDNYLTQIAFDSDVTGFGFRKRNNNNVWSNWEKFYHSANCNNYTTDWAAKNINLLADGSYINFYGNAFVAKELGSGLVLGSLNGLIKVKDTKSDVYYTLYHSGNCNNSTTHWTANYLHARELRAHGVSNANGTALDIKPSDGNGENKAGGNLYLWGGAGTGSGKGGDIYFYTGNTGSSGTTVNTKTAKAIITNLGNFGLGTIAPDTKLHVAGDIKAHGFVQSLYGEGKGFRIFASDGLASSSMEQTDTRTIFIHNEDETDANSGHGYFDFLINSPKSTSGAAKNRFRIRDKSSYLFTILDNGNVGINTTTPACKLDVVGDIKASNIVYSANFKGLPVGTNSVGSLTQLIGSDGNGSDKAGGETRIFGGRGRGKGAGGSVRIYTANASDTTSSDINNWVESAIFRYDGFVGIGTSNPSERLTVAGSIDCYGLNSRLGNMPKFGSINARSKDERVVSGLNIYGNGESNKMICVTHDGSKGIITTEWASMPTGNTPIHITANYGDNKNQLCLGVNGNVGIGVSNPTYRLHSVDTIKAPSFSGTKIRIECNEDGTSSNRDSEINNYQSNLFLQHNSSRNLIMCHGGGSVGIGTLSPTSKFHVVGTSKLIGNTSIGGNLAVEGTINAVGQISTEDEVIASGDIKSTSGGIMAAGEVIAYKAATALQEGTPVGSVVVYDGLDSTSPDVALSANMGRALNADVLATRTLANNAAKTATWSSITGTPDAFTPCEHNHYDSVYPSDRRLKHNIETIEKGLNYVLSMNPVKYVWSAEAISKFNIKESKAYGLIAQELELLLPECTTKIDGDTLGVDYIKIIPFLIAAIKDLDAKLAVTNQKINTMTKAQNRAYSASYTNEKEIGLLKEQIALQSKQLTQQSEQINQLMNKLN